MKADLFLESMDDLDRLFEQATGEPVLVFKHSTRCPISSAALREYEEFLQNRSEGKPLCAMVLVVEHRPVSLEFANKSGVPHQSPQAVLLKDGKAVFDASHGSITAKALAEAVGG